MCVEFYGGPWDGHVAHSATGEIPYTVVIPIFPAIEVGFVFNSTHSTCSWVHYYQLDQANIDLGIIGDSKPMYRYKGVVQR